MLARLIARTRSFWRGMRRTGDADMLEEFRLHVELRAADLIRSGVPPVEAFRRARVEFGSREHYRHEARQARGLRVFDDLRFSWLDLKLGGRMLVKYPGLSVVGGLGMAVVIAISTGTFAISTGLFAGLPFHEGDRIVALDVLDTRWNDEERRIVHEYAAWRAELKSVKDLGAYRTITRNLITAGGPGEPVAVAEMTASGFRVTRVPTMLGRALLEDDEREGAPPVLVVGYRAWRSRFASDSAIVGKQVRLGGVTHTVVGVMPEGFEFPVTHDYWMPLRVDPTDYDLRRGPAIFVFGRLADGATLGQARAEVAAIGQRMAADFPKTHGTLRPRVLPYPDAYNASDEVWQLGLIQLLIIVLLVVVCTNVATLVYARTAARRGEIAVRSALGATRRRIIGHLLAEALVLSAVAATVGLAVAAYALAKTDAIVAEMGHGLPFWMRFGLSWSTVAYATVLAIVGAVIAGVVPALKATRGRVHSNLQQLSHTAAGMHLGRTWTVLIVAQAAFAVAVIPTAVFHAREFVRYGTAEPGFAANELLMFRLMMDRATPPTSGAERYDREYTSRYALLQAELVRRLQTEPAVTDVITLSGMPGQSPRAQVEVEGRAGRVVGSARVDTGFFDALDVPIVAGRPFNGSDVGDLVGGSLRDGDGDGFVEFHGGDAVTPSTAVIVNRSFVREVLGGQNAVGRRVRYTGRMDDAQSAQTERWYAIVGVAEDFPLTPMEPDSPQAAIYHPLANGALRESIALRLRGVPPLAFAGRLREITTAVDPGLRLHEIRPLDVALREEHRAMRLSALGIALLTVSVLLLAAAGIYAMMSFTVERRRREIGIRIALGADRGRVVRGIFARAFGQLAIGIGAGVVLAPVLLTVGGGMTGDKAVVLVAVSGFILLVGLIASIGPTRRSLRIQPSEALKEA
jgi:predicted permease